MPYAVSVVPRLCMINQRLKFSDSLATGGVDGVDLTQITVALIFIAKLTKEQNSMECRCDVILPPICTKNVPKKIFPVGRSPIH